MATIRTAIELQDNFTGVLYSIINAVNSGVSAMGNLQQAMNAPVDATSFDAARSSIDQAMLAVQELDAAIQDIQALTIGSPTTNINTITQQPDLNIPESVTVDVVPVMNDSVNIEAPEQVQIPVEAVVTGQPTIDVPGSLNVDVVPMVTEQPVIDTPEQIEVPVTPVVTEQAQIDALGGVTVGVTPVVTQQPDLNIPESVTVDVQAATITAEQRITDIQQQLQGVNRMQEAINTVANNAYVLPDDTVQELTSVNREIRRMQAALDYIRDNPFNLDSSYAALQIDSLTNSISTAIERQRELNSQLGNMPEQIVNIQVQVEQPEPVQVPVHWQSDNVEVFTNSGVERFEQEVQSANNMLNTLNQTQSRIAETAAQTDLFPENAIADMNNMQSRLQAIQQRIQTIENNPLNMGTDTANAELEQLRGQLDQAVQEQQNLNRAVDNMDVQAANDAYLRLQQIIGDTERHIRDNVDEQGRLNREIEQGTHEANELMQMIGGIVAAYATVQTLSSALNLSDTLASTTARLNMMNDGLQTTQDLQNMIYLSAERARGSYQATADAVSKLGLMAGDAFDSSAEIIAFMEQVNKQFRIAGTEAAGIDAAMLQLTQAMGSGVLRGEEYNSILEQAPNIIQTIADYLEVPKGQLKDMAAEGKITADIVKAAMFAAADETNEKFESMPMTFEQIWTSFENTSMMALQPLLEQLNDIANNDAFKQLVTHATDAISMLVAFSEPIIERIANTQALWDFANGAIDALSLVGVAALEIFDLLVAGAQLLADNWSWLSPIIYGVAAALAVYYGWQMAVNAINLISNGIHVAMAVWEGIHAAAIWATTGATWAEVTAQNGLNAAMYACPIVWIIVLIIALIALFYAAVAAVNKFAGTSVSATGIICGVFMVAAAFIGNLFVTLINFVIDIFVVLWNFIAAFANFFGNVFNDPVSAIARLFFDLVDCILGLLESLASAIDTIFGSNLAGAVAGWRDSLGGWVDETFGQGEEIMAKMDASSLHLERFEYKGAWDAGYSFGEGIDESISNFDPSSLFGTTDIPSADDYASALSAGGVGSGIDDIAGNTGAMADSMDITGEELKYLRDIAEQEAINRFTTAEISIEQTNHNTIKNGMDLDGIMSGMTDMVNEAIDISTEGVHD